MSGIHTSARELRLAETLKAAIWKELRQSLGWGALGLVVAGASLAYVLRSDSGAAGILLDGLYTSTSVLAACLALVIGVAQTLPESRGDRWAFLTHRPVRRSTLFLAKAVAGLALYAAAMGIPLICAIAWIVMPGHVAIPLDWHMLLPIAVNLFCGIAYLCAGLLIGVRQAPWYGSRLFAIGVPLCCSVSQFLVAEFWQALLCCAIGILITGAAAWGCFVANERFENQPLPFRAATGAVVGMGVALGGLLGLVAIELVFWTPGVTERLQDRRHVEYVVTRSGGIVRTTQQGSTIIDATDPDGHPVDRAEGNLSEIGLVARAAAPLEPGHWSYRDKERFFTEVAASGGRPVDQLSFYYVRRSGLIAAYDSQKRQLVGWMGPDGFSEGKTPPDRQFDGSPGFGYSTRFVMVSGFGYQWPGDNRQFLLAFTKAVYQLDLDALKVEKIFAPEAEEEVVAASRGSCNSSRPCTAFNAIVTTRRIIVQALNGKTELAAMRDPQAAGYVEVRVFRALFAPGTPTLVWYYPASHDFVYRVSPFPPQLVTRYDGGETHYALPSPVSRTNPSWDRVVLPWVATPVTVPLAWSLRQARATWRSLDSTLGTTWFDVGEYGGTGSMSLEFFTNSQLAVVWGLCAMASLLSAGFAVRVGRRWALPRSRMLFWTVLSFVLGPVGFSLMGCLLERPVMEDCPACRRMRVVTRENCEHCGQPFSGPPLDGTEIFESVPSINPV